MKTKLILFLLIFGIVILDISCRRNKTTSQAIFEITDISSIFNLKLNSQNQMTPLTKDYVDYDSIIFEVNFMQTKVAKVFTPLFFPLVQAVMADIAPPPNLLWDLDSVKVFSISNNKTVELTNQFSLATPNGELKKVRNCNNLHLNFNTFSQPRFLLSIDSPLAEIDTFRFHFQFFDKKGRLIEKTSPPIIITNH